MRMYVELAMMLTNQMEHWTRLARQLKQIVLYAAFEAVHCDLKSIAIWKRVHPLTGERTNYLKVHNHIILLSNQDVALLRCVLLNYDEEEEPDPQVERTKLIPRLRYEILARDGFTCQTCGNSPPGVALHVDHIVPIKLGGETVESNLRTTCDNCNVGKSDTFCPESIKPEYLLIPPGDAFMTNWDGYLPPVRKILKLLQDKS